MEEGQIFNLVVPAKSFYQVSMDSEEKKSHGEEDYISFIAQYHKTQSLMHNTGLRF